MNILKTPQEKLMEDAGMAPASPGMLNTPKQMLMQETGIVPRLADGGTIGPSKNDMELALIANGRTPPRFQYAEGGRINASFSQDEFHQLQPLFVALGLIDPKDNIEYQK